MSFKDLERSIKQRAQALFEAQQKLADKKRRKQQRTQFNRDKARRGPMYKPDPPPSYDRVVIMNVRRKVDGSTGELFEVRYTVGTFRDDVAETLARAWAGRQGYEWRGTVDIVNGEPI